MRGVVVVMFALAASTAIHLAAQSVPVQAPSTFRAGVDLVSLDVSVLNRDREPVKGLTASDFTIHENGVPQPIVAFGAVDLPAWSAEAAAWMREVGPDVATNRPDARRAVVIVLDDFGVRRDPRATRAAKTVARATVDQLGPADLGAVVYTLNRDQGQEFTQDRPRLRAAVDRFMPSGLAPQTQGRMSAEVPTRGLVMPSSYGRFLPSGACQREECVLMALRNAAEILRAWPDARKMLVLITPGRRLRDREDLDDALDDFRRTIAALQQANVTVYEFDPHGLEVEWHPTDFRLFADNLTGGRAITNTNAPGDFVPQMFRENDSYYLLGFRPTDGRRDGRFRRIKVQVNRPGVEVRARAGYFAPTDRPSKPPTRAVSAADRALSGGLPTGDLPLSLAVAPFAIAEKPRAAVAIVTRVDRPDDVPAGAAVELKAVAFTETWKEVATITEKFMLPADGSSASRSVEMGTRLNLPPGRYEVRVAMTSPATDRTGSVYTSVIVPNFAREPLSISGVVLERTFGGAAMPDKLASLVPARPTAARTFAPGDPVALLARVYQGGSKPLAAVRMMVRIVDEQDRPVFTTDTTLDPKTFDLRQRQADYRLDLPLGPLAAGEHLLRLEASAGAMSAHRDLRFTMRR